MLTYSSVRQTCSSTIDSSHCKVSQGIIMLSLVQNVEKCKRKFKMQLTTEKGSHKIVKAQFLKRLFELKSRWSGVVSATNDNTYDTANITNTFLP